MSNVFFGAQNIATGVNRRDPSIRVNIKNLVTELEKDKLRSEIKTRVVGGGATPKTARVWEHWESCGYKCIVGGLTANHTVSCILDNYHIKITLPFSFLAIPGG